MNTDLRDERSPEASNTTDGPLRHFRVGRRAVLQSLATGAGVAAFAAAASAAPAHVHGAAAAAPSGTASVPDSQRVYLDEHAFATLALLCEQIVPGARAAQVPEFLDRLLAVESTDTQKHFTQALGAFERAAREAHGKPWKSLSESEATALLTKISTLPDNDVLRQTFEGAKRAIAESYYSTEPGMKELGWNHGVAFAPPAACG